MIEIKRLYVSALFFAGFCMLAHTAYADTVLVDEGSSEYTIVVSDEASSTERYAASELQHYLEKMSSVKLPIKNIGSLSNTSRGIYIGEDLVRQQNISVPKSKLGWDGFIIKNKGDNLYLAGLQQRGTLYAVYDLLERLGARWFAPNFKFYAPAQAEMIPKLSTISIPELHIVSKPDLKYRKKYVEEGRTHTAENMAKLIDWMAKAKLNVFVHPENYRNAGNTVWDSVRTELIPELDKRGMVLEVGGHGYQNYLPPAKYFDDHPEWFGMKDGKRSKKKRVVFNTANEEAIDELIMNISRFLKNHPEIDIFDLWPPDLAQWSEDPQSINQGTPSERQAIVLNHVTQALNDDFPNVTVEFLAYEDYTEPPANQQFVGDNLLMDFAPIRRSYAYPFWDHRHPKNAYYDDALRAWSNRETYTGEISFYSYYRKYAWRSLPIVFPRLIAREIHYFNALGIDGIGSYSEPGDWFTYELTHYVTAKSSWNSNIDIKALLNDYTSHRYKKASDLMNKYIWLIEETTRKANRIIQTNVQKSTIDYYLGNLQQAKKLLDKALSKTDDAGVQSLVRKLELTLKYARLDLEIRQMGFEITEHPQPFKSHNKKLQQRLNAMKKLFNKNLDKGIFISRNGWYY